MMAARTLGFLFACLFCTLAVAAEPQFPKLTGRVVDNAGMIDSAAERRIAELSAGHENATGNQLVVVSLPDLQGLPIETYGYQLGRHWGIGQKGENNGVLLIVAKRERKVRIEVGYGLEGILTDAISSNIVHAVILPSFKRGRFSEGIEVGATAVIQALGGEYKVKERKTRSDKRSPWLILLFIIWAGLFFARSFWGGGLGGGYYGGGHYGGGRSGGGGFGGGGFSGGGGGFGGGGASGGW